MSFVHLHVHSEYSLLDGLSRIPELVQRTKELDMPAVALTDHGVMFGVIDFYRQAKDEGVKPIIGMETYMAARRMHERDAKLDASSFHLLLLAENNTGYENLLKIATHSQLDGFYYRPRIDHEFLQAHSEGLICTTGCLSGEVPRYVLQGNLKRAEQKLDWYLQVFGRDRFFVELQHHEIPELPEVNKRLVQLAKQFDANLVATNDVHYVNADDSELQDILLCIQTGSVRADPQRMRMTDPSYFLRSPQEMQQIFGEIPSALENTLRIAERCEVDLDFKGYHLPHFDVPEGKTAKGYLRELCDQGLRRRYGERADDPEVKQRLDYELGIIQEMGFETYFLIVWDLCRYAMEQDIWYNARGSAAASIVAYSLDITIVDPLAHDLIFERFLNPDRISMPDIDLDFQDDKRYLMLEYTAQKYGHDKVAQIITFGTMGARAAIRDVGRVMDIPLPEVDRVAKQVPNIPGKSVSIPEVLETSPSFRKVYESAPYLKEMIDTAARLDGVVRNAGTHAAGLIMTPKPIVDYLPLHRPTGAAQDDHPIRAVTQFKMQIIDSLGLLKVDFLGLSTLTVMARACKTIHARHGLELDINSIPLDDPETYELLGRGEVCGVFQVEGAGMRRYLMDMKPKELANVVAMVALYRPGPMEFIPDYIKRMRQEEPVVHRHPALEPIFGETYGIPIYQEQLMRAAIDLGGYSASEADGLRKAISKKDAASIKKHRKKFVQGASKGGIPRDTAAAVFKEWENFARYGFNKAHAADYGMIAVQTAYLKAHYPLEYMAALLSVFKHDNDRVAIYIADCRRMGLGVLPPDINTSGLDFELEDTPSGESAIRFGLAAVKNVGEGAVEAILEVRRQGGPFQSLADFARRTDLRQVGKRALECLVQVGAFDGLGSRSTVLHALDQIIGFSASHFRAADAGQISLFGAATGVRDALDLPKPTWEPSHRQLLGWEKDLLGVYVSDHPLNPYMKELTQIVSHFSSELSEAEHGKRVCVAGMVEGVRPYLTKAGQEMGFASLEDIQGKIDLVIFSRVWERVSEWLRSDMVVVVHGSVDRDRGDPKILVNKISRDIGQVDPEKDSRVGSEPRASKLEKWNAGVEYETTDSSNKPMREMAREAASQPAEDLSSDTDPGPPETRTTDPTPPLERSPSEPPSQPSERANDQSREDDWTDPQEQMVVTVVLHSTGDGKRDSLRMRRVQGLLTSYPGSDRFAFHVYEDKRHYRLEFPSNTTGCCPELRQQLAHLVGEGNIRVESLSTILSGRISG